MSLNKMYRLHGHCVILIPPPSNARSNAVCYGAALSIWLFQLRKYSMDFDEIWYWKCIHIFLPLSSLNTNNNECISWRLELHLDIQNQKQINTFR